MNNEPLNVKADISNSPSDYVWGAKSIAAEIGRTPRQAFYLLERGLIPGAKKVGSQWVALRSKLRTALAGEGA